jgi:hypothetical protein
MKSSPSTNKSGKKTRKKSTQKKKSSPIKTVRRIPGIDKGRVIIKPDFDDPLPEFEQ